MLVEASDFVDEMPEDQIESLISLMGSYVLAVAAYEFEGQFYWHDQYDQPVFVAGEPECNIALITFNKVKGRLNGDSADNIPFFYNGFASQARISEPNSNVMYV